LKNKNKEKMKKIDEGYMSEEKRNDNRSFEMIGKKVENIKRKYKEF
jgi:hypothetical protein